MTHAVVSIIPGNNPRVILTPDFATAVHRGVTEMEQVQEDVGAGQWTDVNTTGENVTVLYDDATNDVLAQVWIVETE